MTAEELIGAWWPRGISQRPVVPAEVAQVRRLVSAASPWDDRPKELRTVLRYCWEYLNHRLAEGLDCDPAAMFAEDQITAYRAGLQGARGSIDARCSYLRRLHPDVGLTGTTRVQAGSGASTAEPRSSPPATPNEQTKTRRPAVTCTDDVPAEVAEVLARHRPQLIEPALWAQVGEVTRAAVTATAPQHRSRAVRLLTEVAYLAGWVAAQHRPLRLETVLDGSSIEGFLDVLVRAKGRTPRGLATLATNLHTVRAANGIACNVARRPFPAAATKAPYSPAEIDELYATARRSARQPRFAQIRGAFGLVLGAGAASGEAGWVTPEDVHRVNGRVAVSLGVPAGHHHHRGAEADPAGIERRVVTIEDDYADDVLAAVRMASTRGERFILGGTGARRNNRLNRLLNGSTASATVHFDVTRARMTWLVEAAASGRYPVITDLLDIAGARTLERIADALPHIRARRAELAAGTVATLPTVALPDHGGTARDSDTEEPAA